MDINQIISIVLQVLLQILPKISEKAQETLGSEIVKAPFKLYEIIRHRFQESDETKKALDNLQTNPSDVKNQELFRKQLASILEKDQTFASTLKQFIIDSNISNVIKQESITINGGNQNSITQYTTQNVAENLNLFVNILLNTQEKFEPGTLGKALLDLPLTASSLPSISRNEKGIDVIEQLKDLLTKSSVEFEYDNNLISKVLRPAIQAETTKNNIPSSGKFLRRLVSEIGRNLHQVEVFRSNQFATIGSDHDFQSIVDENGYRSERILRKLPMPELAKDFNVDSVKLSLVQVTTYWKKTNITKNVPNEEKTFIAKITKSFTPKPDLNKPEVIFYDLQYDDYSILPEGEEHHVVFSREKERSELETWERLGGRTESKNRRTKTKSLDDKVYKFSAEILAKFLMATLHDYLAYMHPQATIERMLDMLSSQIKDIA
jgi:hypothetical protein